MPMASRRAPLRRRLGELCLGDQVAGGRIRSRERDAGGLADLTAPAVAPDEILRPQRAVFTQFDIHAGFVLREARYFNAAIDRHLELVDPAAEDPLDVVLPQPEAVRMAGGKAAEIEMDSGKRDGLRLLPLGKEAIGNAALIEDLEGARVESARA